MVLAAISIQFKFVHVCLFICRYNFLRARKYRLKVAFVDPATTNQQAIDNCERIVEDYLINVMEKSKDKDLILWPFHKE